MDIDDPLNNLLGAIKGMMIDDDLLPSDPDDKRAALLALLKRSNQWGGWMLTPEQSALLMKPVAPPIKLKEWPWNIKP